MDNNYQIEVMSLQRTLERLEWKINYYSEKTLIQGKVYYDQKICVINIYHGIAAKMVMERILNNSKYNIVGNYQYKLQKGESFDSEGTKIYTPFIVVEDI